MDVQDMRFCPYCNETKAVGHDCPAGAVGCTTNPPDGPTCGECVPCLNAQRADLIRYGSPNDLDHPREDTP